MRFRSPPRVSTQVAAEKPLGPAHFAVPIPPRSKSLSRPQFHLRSHIRLRKTVQRLQEILLRDGNSLRIETDRVPDDVKSAFGFSLLVGNCSRPQKTCTNFLRPIDIGSHVLDETYANDVDVHECPAAHA